MLNKNQITPSSKHYDRLHNYFNKYNLSIHKTTGLQLIQTGDFFKLQIPPREKISITKSDTTTTYQMYLLIAAYLITKQFNEPFRQSDLYDEIQGEIRNIPEKEKESMFRQVVYYMINENILKSEREYGDDDEFVVLRKAKEAYGVETKPNDMTLSIVAQIAKHLFLNQTMNKLHYKELWNHCSDEKLIEHFDKLSTENIGFKLVFDGNIVRLLSKSDKKGFPNVLKNEHRLLVDILPDIQSDLSEENITKVMKESKLYNSQIKATDLLKTIEEFDLKNIKIKRLIENEEQ